MRSVSACVSLTSSVHCLHHRQYYLKTFETSPTSHLSVSCNVKEVQAVLERTRGLLSMHHVAIIMSGVARLLTLQPLPWCTPCRRKALMLRLCLSIKIKRTARPACGHCIPAPLHACAPQMPHGLLSMHHVATVVSRVARLLTISALALVHPLPQRSTDAPFVSVNQE